MQLLLGDGAQSQPSLVERHDAVHRPVEPRGDLVPREHEPPHADGHDDVLGRRRHGQHGRQLELLQHPGGALGSRRLGVVEPGDDDLRHAQVEHRALPHASFAERRQDVGHVVEEGPVRTDDQHAVTRQAAAMLEQQVRRPVQRHGRLAGSWTALHDEHLVDRGADDEVLFGLDRRHDLAHRPGPLGADLGEHGVGDAAGSDGCVGIIEMFVQVGRQLTVVEHEAAA